MQQGLRLIVILLSMVALSLLAHFGGLALPYLLGQLAAVAVATATLLTLKPKSIPTSLAGLASEQLATEQLREQNQQLAAKVKTLELALKRSTGVN